eukprot:g3481.t1
MSSKGILRKAFAAFQEGDFATAEDHCLSAIRLDSTSYDAHLLLGKCAYSTGAIDKAEEQYIAATELNPEALPAWQGLAELFERSSTDSEKAVVPLQRIISLLQDNEERQIQTQLRLSNLLSSLDRRSEAEGVLQEILDRRQFINDEQRLQVLCLLADLQLLDYEKAINDRLQTAFETLRCGLEYKPECDFDALQNRVTSEYAEEALEADRKLGTTLKAIIQLAPPCGHYKKFHEFYLQLFSKAMYCTPPQSIQRYNSRLQTLETCYKMIHGHLSPIKGLCTSPFPYVTALRLLEINDEIVGGQRAVGGQKLGALVHTPRELKSPSMFKSESSPALHQLPPSPSKSIRISLTRKVSGLEAKNQSNMETGGSPMARRLSLDGTRASFRVRGSPKFSSPSTPGSPGVMAPLVEGQESNLPRFMRSSSLSCVRKLHRLDSGFLPGVEDVIGGNSALVTEISDSIGRKLARLMPWHPESQIQMCLAIERSRRSHRHEIVQADTTHLTALIHDISPDVIKRHIELLSQGISSGSHLVSPRIALVELLMDQGRHQEALDACDEALDWILSRKKEGGYPRIQAALTFRLLRASALLNLKQFDESETCFQSLTDSVSEGEVTLGALIGRQSVSIHQTAQRGLAKVALARGDRLLALRRYEQMMGAGILGKSPIEHSTAAEYGFMLYEDSDTVRAKQYLEKALRILNSIPPPYDIDRIRAEYQYKLGQVYWTLGGKWRNQRQFACQCLQSASVCKGPFQALALRLLGEYYSEVEGDLNGAQECWEKALKLDPEQESSGLALFQLMKLQNHSFVELKAFCVRYITLATNSQGPRTFWMYNCQGDLYMEQSLYQSAIASFQKVLKLKYKDPVIWEKLGTAHFKSKRLTSAQKCFCKALELEPKRIYALVKLGDCLLELEELNEALGAYRAALGVDSGSPVVMSSLVSCLLTCSKLKYNEGSLGLAADYITEAKELLKDFEQKHKFLKVFCKLEADVKQWSSQLDSVDSLIKMQSASDVQTLVSVIKNSLKMRHQDLREARALYARMLKLYPFSATAWGDYARSQIHEGSMESKSLHKLVLGGLAIDSSSSELWCLLGTVQISPHEKEYAFSRALQLESSHVKSWVELARLYKTHGHHEVAREALIQARSHDACNALVWEAMSEIEDENLNQSMDCLLHAIDLQGPVSCYLSLALKFISNWPTRMDQDIKNALQRCIYLFPLNPIIWNGHGLVMEEDGKFQKALFSFEMSLTLLLEEESNQTCIAQVKINVGRVALKANQFHKAREVLQSVPHSSAHLLLAVADYEMGELGEAEKHLEQSMSQLEDLDGKLEAARLLVKINASKHGCLEAVKRLEVHVKGLQGRLNEAQNLELIKIWSLLLSRCQIDEEFSIVRSQMMELGIELGIENQTKAEMQFVKFKREHNRVHIMTALHYYPWNQDYQLYYNLHTLQDQLQSSTCTTPWSRKMLISLLDPDENPLETLSLWIFSFRGFEESSMDVKVQFNTVGRHAMKLVRLYPQSLGGWFILAVIGLNQSRKANLEDRTGVLINTSKSLEITIKLLDSLDNRNIISEAMKDFLRRNSKRET